MRPNGGVRTFLLAKEKIEWTTTTPISRGKVNTYAQLASLGYPRVHRNGWVFKYSSGEYLVVTGNVGPTFVVRQFAMRTGPMFLVCMTLALAWMANCSYGRRRGRRSLGCCPGCGYDLRASPERCPECGRAVGRSVTGSP